jgi:hypothetical protein
MGPSSVARMAGEGVNNTDRADPQIWRLQESMEEDADFGAGQVSVCACVRVCVCVCVCVYVCIYVCM